MSAEIATLVAAAIAAVAAIVAAGVSVFIGYYQASRISKLRLAEFRRDWIEDLRRSFARYMALEKEIEGLENKFGDDGGIYADEKYISIVRDRQECFSYVALMLNSDEKDHKEILDLMLLMSNNRLKKQEIDEVYKERGYTFTDKARKILKNEWKRLKQEM